jgi:hypothetical protein
MCRATHDRALRLPDNLVVQSDARGDRRRLSAIEVARIADAFELSSDEVSADAALVEHWSRGQDELLQNLQARRDWDTSLTEYYLPWLRGEGADPDF